LGRGSERVGDWGGITALLYNEPMYTVFADQHHFGLYNSLKLLFEDRLGGTLYRPIGREWLDAGYWRIAEIYNNHPTTIAQYLGIHDDYVSEDGVYNIWENGHKFFQHAITLDRFMREPIDIVIASVPEHVESFARLCATHPNHPKFIYQIGNSWNIDGSLPVKNIMASARMGGMSIGLHTIEYHQEFDTKIFKPRVEFSYPDNNIFSFINCLNTASIYAHDWPLFTGLESAMPDWKWQTFGGSCRDGEMNGQQAVADKMREAKFVWHVKAGGDGYGHVLHSAIACGRPLIVKKSYYMGKLAEPLLIDGVTCIDIDGLSIPQIVNKIVDNSKLDRYLAMCQAAHQTFAHYVDFNAEGEALKQFMQNLV